MCKVPALVVLLSLSLYSYALRAQTTNGSITGRLTDPSKATIPDAKVAAVNAGTNFRYESATNGAGEYALAIQWNVASEKALGSSQSVSLTYIGATGRLDLPELYDGKDNCSGCLLIRISGPGRRSLAQPQFQH